MTTKPVTPDEVLERVWNENRADCPRWHTLTNSERYRLGVMFRAALAAAGPAIDTQLRRDVVLSADDAMDAVNFILKRGLQS